MVTYLFDRDLKATLNGTDKSYRLYVAKTTAFRLSLLSEEGLTYGPTGKHSKT
jgi:hypothetical protein